MISEANKRIIASLARKIDEFTRESPSLEEIVWNLETTAGLLERDSTELPRKTMDIAYGIEEIQTLIAAAEQRPAAIFLLDDLLEEFDKAIEPG